MASFEDAQRQERRRKAADLLKMADKLFKVWPKDGVELWLLIHVEVQNQPDEQFGERMYSCGSCFG